MSTEFHRYPESGKAFDDDYIASCAIATAVNTALAVEQPLVVTGKPGTGKTGLAESIAKRLGRPLHKFVTRSDHQAKDCLYTFDALRRLYDAQVKDPRAEDPVNYVSLNALGKAITSAEPCVVLIDEIDKAPRDFPNDLLGVLEDKLEFVVPEAGKTYPEKGVPAQRPFILITSNEERRLPDAFLRRCVFHYIDFPDTAQLQEIVTVNLKKKGVDVSALPEKFVETLVARFNQLRQERFEKEPATSELVAWARVLVQAGITDPQELKARGMGELFPGVLFKHKEDLQKAQMRVGKGAG